MIGDERAVPSRIFCPQSIIRSGTSGCRKRVSRSLFHSRMFSKRRRPAFPHPLFSNSFPPYFSQQRQHPTPRKTHPQKRTLAPQFSTNSPPRFHRRPTSSGSLFRKFYPVPAGIFLFSTVSIGTTDTTAGSVSYVCYVCSLGSAREGEASRGREGRVTDAPRHPVVPPHPAPRNHPRETEPTPIKHKKRGILPSPIT